MILLITMGVLAAGAGDGGEPEPLVTDRPDFTEATPTVPAGRVQLEMGYTFTSGEGVREHDLGELLLRVGVGERLELRLGGPSAAFDSERDASGCTDASVGVKMRLVDGEGSSPALSVIAQTTVPLHDADFGGGEPKPEVKVLWSMDLPRGLSLAGNVNFAARVAEDGGRYFEPAASVSLGIPVADRVGAYVEYFAFVPAGGGSAAGHYVNGGLTFLATPDLQFDVRVGTGLNEDADDFFAGVGMAVRF